MDTSESIRSIIFKIIPNYYAPFFVCADICTDGKKTNKKVKAGKTTDSFV